MLKKYFFVLPFTLAGLVLNAQAILDSKAVNSVPATHLDFDGINDYVNCGNLAPLKISGNNITLEAKVKFKSFAPYVAYGNIINKERNNPDQGYMLRAGSTGIVNFNLGNGGWNELNSPANVVTIGVWHHIAATYDGATMKIFVDGVLVATEAVVNINFLSPNQNLTIGAWSYVGRLLNAAIDEVRVWNIARTAAQIQHYMNCELPNPSTQSGLVAYYKFNSGTNGADNSALYYAIDDSPTGHVAFLNNFALNGTASNWLSGSAVVTGNNCTTLSSDEFESYAEEVKVYPNPSSGIFNFQTQEAAQLEVYDLIGKMILTKSVQAGTASLDLSEQAPGMYLLKITNGSGNTAVCKMIKQ